MAELVDALASGASGLTAVKVRVLSWAPLALKRSKSRWHRVIGPLTGTQNRDTVTVTCRIAHLQGLRLLLVEFQNADPLRRFGQAGH